MGFVLPAVVGVAGAAVGLQAFARTTVPMGPFDVQLDAVAGQGRTDIALPPLGVVSAATHVAPVHLSATLTDVDVKELQTLIGDEGLDGVAQNLEDQAVHRIWPFLLRSFGVALAGALVAALVAYRGRRREVRIAMLAALVAVGGSGALAVATFDASAFLQPDLLRHARAGPAGVRPPGLDRRARRLLPRPAPRDRGRGLERVLGHRGQPAGSRRRDPYPAHLRHPPVAAGLRLRAGAGEGLRRDLVLDTGDITSFGTPAENVVASFIPAFQRPYVFVRGSHDSISLQQAIARVPNAEVVDGTAVTVKGITIYGLGDPYFVEQRGAPQSDAAIEELVRSVGPRLVADVTAMATPPDIVAGHDDRMAEDAAGLVPLVASGHFHENSATVRTARCSCASARPAAPGPPAASRPTACRFRCRRRCSTSARHRRVRAARRCSAGT